MDALFEEHCTRCKRFYLLYILVDLALIAYAYTIGHLALICFTLISITSVFLHLLLILFLPTSGRKKRVHDVARMANYDGVIHRQVTDLAPLRRFALLTRHPLMSQWHICTMLDIALPTTASLIVTFVYFMLSLENVVFLGVFVTVRVLIALLQYRTLSTFYNRAVSDSFNAVIKKRDFAITYARSRSNTLINAALQLADDHLKYISNPHEDNEHVHGRAKKRAAEQSNTFSGVAIDRVQNERIVRTNIEHI
jgi:hypothetical protein